MTVAKLLTQWRESFSLFLCLVAVILVNPSGSIIPLKAGTESVPPPEYRLNHMDRVRLKVFEWRPALDEVFEWKALNDEYLLGPTGKIALPLIGEVDAREKTPSQLGEDISELIRSSIGILQPPKVSVEIVGFRPFYILGEVQKPGEYDYRPQLNVMQAVSLAGGLLRPERLKGANRELIRLRGDVAVLSRDYLSQMARLARLKATLTGAGNIEFPPELLMHGDTVTALLDQERAIFKTEQLDYQANLGVLAARKRNLESEVEGLLEQLENHKREQELAKAELEKVEKLVARKLAVEPRKLASLRNVYQLEGLRLRQQAELVRVRQGIDDAAADIAKFRGERRKQIMADLRETTRAVDEAFERLKTTKLMLRETIASAPTSGLSSKELEGAVRYEIIRNTGGFPRVIEAINTTLVNPGDTISVKIETPELDASSPMSGLSSLVEPMASGRSYANGSGAIYARIVEEAARDDAAAAASIGRSADGDKTTRKSVRPKATSNGSSSGNETRLLEILPSQFSDPRVTDPDFFPLDDRTGLGGEAAPSPIPLPVRPPAWINGSELGLPERRPRPA